MIPVVVLTVVLGISALGTADIFASSQNQRQLPIVQKLAEKFGLKQNEVQAVFDEVRNERQAKNQTQFEDRLTQAVKDGKMTEVQKQAVLAKHQELIVQQDQLRNNWQNLTPEERQNTRQTQKQALESWAKQNGIDLKYLFNGFGKRGFFGR